MATAPIPLSWDEYMATSYSPDCEYVDGQLLERNGGQNKHSYTQSKLSVRLDPICERLGFIALAEQRTKVAPLRVRVPDLSIVRDMRDPVTQNPPVLCIEIRSPEDKWSRIPAVIGDYLEMGVPCVWVIDPWRRQAWIYQPDQPSYEVLNDRLVTPDGAIDISLTSVLPPD